MPKSTVLGCAAACRESFRVFPFITCFMIQPTSRCTYCQSKAQYLWNIFQKSSPYKLQRNPVVHCKRDPHRVKRNGQSRLGRVGKRGREGGTETESAGAAKVVVRRRRKVSNLEAALLSNVSWHKLSIRPPLSGGTAGMGEVGINFCL